MSYKVILAKTILIQQKYWQIFYAIFSSHFEFNLNQKMLKRGKLQILTIRTDIKARHKTTATKFPLTSEPLVCGKAPMSLNKLPLSLLSEKAVANPPVSKAVFVAAISFPEVRELDVEVSE